MAYSNASLYIKFAGDLGIAGLIRIPEIPRAQINKEADS
jgi:hypothetical protein